MLRHGVLPERQHQHYPRIPRVTHYLCLTTYFHYLLPTVSAVFWHLSHVYIPLGFHRFTIKLLGQFPHTAKLTSNVVTISLHAHMLWQPKTRVPLEGSQRSFMDADVHPNSKLNTDGIALRAPTLVYFPSSYPLIWHLVPSTYRKWRDLVIM